MARHGDLDALLGNLDELSPEEVIELLGSLGVHVHRDEATGLKMMALGGPQDKALDSGSMMAGPVSLEPMLEHMNADQLKLVAKRFNPEANAARVADSKKAIQAALKKPALLDKMIANLEPLERALLSELKRQGGAVDGWALIVQLALQGFAPRPQNQLGGGSIYKHYRLSSAPGVRFLGLSLRDGLLIPATNHASWFSSSNYYGYSDRSSTTADDIVLADHRVLARLPDEPRPELKALDLGRLENVTPTASHPLQGLLELFDVMQLVLEDGGLQLTQSGTLNKAMLARLLKRRPWLEGRLERLLFLGLMLGLFEAPSGKAPYRVNLPLLRKLQNAPLPLSYLFMVEAFLQLEEADDEPWRTGRTALVSASVAKRALLESLGLLPGHPVAMQAALETLWKRTLKHTAKLVTRYWSEEKEPEPERPAWFTDTLVGAFQDLGLVAVTERPDAQKLTPKEPASTLHIMRGRELIRYKSASEDDQAHRYALMPAQGLAWLARGRELQAAKAPPSAKEGRALLGLDPKTGKPKEPSLLVQPNFDILVYLDKLSPLAVTALSCADCTRIDAQTASYTMSRASLYRALESGLELSTLITLLQEHSMGVPENVARSLRDWASRRERLRFVEGTRLLEYSNQKERDAALKSLKGARGLAERFILLEGKTRPPNVNVQHQYSLAPTRTLRFHPEGRFRLEGATDLAGRAVLAQLAKLDDKGYYHLDVDAIRAGALTTAARDTLLARAHGGIPPQVEALLSIWEGKSAAPSMAKVTIFQHPSAAALAKHPRVAMHLGKPLNPTSYPIKEGHEDELERLLTGLGVTPTEGFTAELKAEEVQSGVMQTGLNTRKMREMIEMVIAEGRTLELRYHQEKETYDRYGYTNKSKGKVVTEGIKPKSVLYSGSTPYLSGTTTDKGEGRYIRIGYITGIAVL